MAIYSDEGLVLTARAYSNTSLIVTFLTPGRGKVCAMAKGARAAKSRYGASLEPATRVEFEWSERAGAEMGTLRGCETLKVYRRLWNDFEAMTLAGRLLKRMDRLSGPHESLSDLYVLLLAAIEAVDGGADLESIEGIFLVMLLGRMGLAPGLRYCAECGKVPGGESAALDLAQGELRCRRCPRGAGQGVRLRAGSVATMREALSLPLKKMASIKILPSLQGEVIRAGEAFLAYHAGVPALTGRETSR